MFYNKGEVISDEFDHFQVIGFWVLVYFLPVCLKLHLFGCKIPQPYV